jgi:hypothetical protein
MSGASIFISLIVQGNTLPLRVCGTSICGRNGGRTFCDALQTLSAGTDLKVIQSGCMSMCKGVVVAGGPLKRKLSLPLTIDKDDSLGAIENAAEFLEQHGYEDVRAAAAARVAAASGQEALVAEEFLAATAHFTEAIESPLAAPLRADAKVEAEVVGVVVPTFRLKGAAAEAEAERITPARLRWLYESLIGRCSAQLALGADGEAAEAALADAREASHLCPIAGGGWYRQRDAARASGNRALVRQVEAELTRLGYALDVEGPVPTEAERVAMMNEAQRAAAAAGQYARHAALERVPCLSGCYPTRALLARLLSNACPRPHTRRRGPPIRDESLVADPSSVARC